MFNKKSVFCIILLFLIILAGCSKHSVPQQEVGQPAPVSLDGQIKDCYVHEDYYSCTLNSGNTYYITTSYAQDLLLKTRWDKTVWASETIVINATEED